MSNSNARAELQAIARFVNARLDDELAAIIPDLAALPEGETYTDDQAARIRGTYLYQAAAMGIAMRRLAVAAALTYPVMNAAWLRRQADRWIGHPCYREEWRPVIGPHSGGSRET